MKSWLNFVHLNKQKFKDLNDATQKITSEKRKWKSEHKFIVEAQTIELDILRASEQQSKKDLKDAHLKINSQKRELKSENKFILEEQTHELDTLRLLEEKARKDVDEANLKINSLQLEKEKFTLEINKTKDIYTSNLEQVNVLNETICQHVLLCQMLNMV